jgi:hypothetical protein
MGQTAALVVPHHILLIQGDAFFAVSVDALFVKLQINVQHASLEIQQTTKQFASVAMFNSVPAVFQTIFVKIVKIISQLVLQEHV